MSAGPTAWAGAPRMMHTLSMGASAYQVLPWQFSEDFSMPDLDPMVQVEYNNHQQNMLSGPVVLWTAKPMMSHSTGIRPEGEAVRVHGAWWKLEAWTSGKIRQDILQREKFRVEIDALPTYSGPSRVGSILGGWQKDSPVKDLSKSIDEALRSGMSREQIMRLVDNRIIVTTMED